MISCQVTVCGKIGSGTVVKQSADGKKFISFTLFTIITKGKSSRLMALSVSVDDNGKSSIYTEGRRIQVTGTLTMRKTSASIYYNLRASEEIVLIDESVPDKVEGTLFFRGKTSKNPIVIKQDKRGKNFRVFAAYSSEKDGANREYIWIHFLDFSPKEDFVQPSTFIEVEGDLQVNIYQDRLSFEAVVRHIQPWQLSSSSTK